MIESGEPGESPLPSDLKESCLSFVKKPAQREAFQLFAVAQNRLDLLQWSWSQDEKKKKKKRLPVSVGQLILDQNREKMLQWCMTCMPKHVMGDQWMIGNIVRAKPFPGLDDHIKTWRPQSVEDLTQHACYTLLVTILKSDPTFDFSFMVGYSMKLNYAWFAWLLDVHHVSVKKPIRFPETRHLHTTHLDSKASPDYPTIVLAIQHKLKPYLGCAWFRDAIHRMIDYAHDGCTWNTETSVTILRALLEHYPHGSDILDPQSIVEIPLRQYPLLDSLFEKATFEGTVKTLEECLPYCVATDMCREIFEYVRMDFASWTGIVYLKHCSEDENKNGMSDFSVLHSSGMRHAGLRNKGDRKPFQCVTITPDNNNGPISLDMIHLDLRHTYRAWLRQCLPACVLSQRIQYRDTDTITLVSQQQHGTSKKLCDFETYANVFAFIQHNAPVELHTPAGLYDI